MQWSFLDSYSPGLLTLIGRTSSTCTLVDQGFPTWGKCAQKGTFAYLKKHIYCTAETN